MTIQDQSDISAQDIIDFWRSAGAKRWFAKDDAFDDDIRTRFQRVWEDARDGRLAPWGNSDEGTLALILVLDQFPRNIFRDDARAYATDAMALQLCKRAIERGVDLRTPRELRAFVYMPLMHSESVSDQSSCVALCRELGNPDNLKFAEIHADIVRQFGRFPHRNAVLGRPTTPEEAAFLATGGFAG